MQGLDFSDYSVPTDLEVDVILANRRLSIIDLTRGGHQPIPNESNTIWVVCNGEIYNYRELMKELKELGHIFYGESDTEVLVHGFEEWGIDELLKRCVGMWGIAIWDQVSQRLYLARDRFGIKPLYYQISNDFLFFASEIKALREYAASTIDEDIIVQYLWAHNREHDRTFFKEIKRVKSAHYLTVDLREKRMEEKNYWKISNINRKITKFDPKKIRTLFLHRFYSSIKLHLRSDVPVGTCLSGGLDSSSIVCACQNLLDKGRIKENAFKGVKKLSVFSTDPEVRSISEVEYIDEVVDATKVIPYRTRPYFEDFYCDFETLIKAHDEPFQGPTVYMQYQVMKLAKKHGVVVLLDGQGGDESLAGYMNYLLIYLRDLLVERHFFMAIKEFFLTLDLTFPYLKRLIRLIFAKRFRESLQVLKVKPPAITPDPTPKRISLHDQLNYDLTQGNIIELLKYEDINSMHFSIESRVPILSHPLTEFLFGLPPNTKIHNGWVKYCLREGMAEVIPEKIRRRRSKLGFPAPDALWALKMIKSKRNYCLSLVERAEKYIDKEGFIRLCERIVKNRWEEDISLFWRIVILSAWLTTVVN